MKQELPWKLDLVSKLKFKALSCQKEQLNKQQINIQLHNMEEKQRTEDDMEV